MFITFIIGSCWAVQIDPNEGLERGSYSSGTGKAWQMVKLYSSNSPPLFKYENYVRT